MLGGYLLRMLVCIYLPFFQGIIHENNKFALICGGSLSVGLLLAYISEEHLILMIVTGISFLILVKIKEEYFQPKKKSQYEILKER